MGTPTEGPASRDVRVAVEGCGHGTLNAIYASVERSCKERGWDGVDVLIIGGDFQAVRNAADLTVMSVPAKYREMADFHEYYSGARKAPYLTVFVAGNHEASSHLWELYYGGWVAPNIYYMGAANILRLGPLRIAGMSGIWKGRDYRQPHHERLPFNQDDTKTFYHVREFDVRKLLQVRTQVDIGISHDWPRAIEKHGDQRSLFRMKPDFEMESQEGTLGNPAAEYVMDRLRPPYWFSAHLHCKFSAIKNYDAPGPVQPVEPPVLAPTVPAPATSNPDEISLDLDDEDNNAPQPPTKPTTNPDEIPLSDDEDVTTQPTTQPTPQPAPQTTAPDTTTDVETLRSLLPPSFARPSNLPPGQPVPSTIPNRAVRFLALDKCLPGRKFLQLLSLPSSSSSNPPFKLQYDPEWLAITRAFHPFLNIGERNVPVPPDKGEAYYGPLIDKEMAWVEENVVKKGKLGVPEDFVVTAPVYVPDGEVL
ncbi:hypothetical protein OQA88_12074 [Cercophora sp. LCS_1]